MNDGMQSAKWFVVACHDMKTGVTESHFGLFPKSMIGISQPGASHTLILYQYRSFESMCCLKKIPLLQ